MDLVDFSTIFFSLVYKVMSVANILMKIQNCVIWESETSQFRLPTMHKHCLSLVKKTPSWVVSKCLQFSLDISVCKTTVWLPYKQSNSAEMPSADWKIARQTTPTPASAEMTTPSKINLSSLPFLLLSSSFFMSEVCFQGHLESNTDHRKCCSVFAWLHSLRQLCCIWHWIEIIRTS